MLYFNRNHHPASTQFLYNTVGFQQSLWLIPFSSLCTYLQLDSVLKTVTTLIFHTMHLTVDSFRATLIISQCQILEEMLTFCYRIIQSSLGSFQPFAVTQKNGYSAQSGGQYFRCQEFCSHPDELLQQPNDISEAGESQAEILKRT